MNTTKDTCVALLAFAALAALPAVAGVKYWDNPAFKAYDVGDYVQDGLVLHYDGLRNAGAEADHSDTTDTWVNLASDGAYPMGWCSWILNSADSKYYIRNGNTESGSWAANGFVFDGTAVFAATNITFGIGATYTHQLVMTASTADLKDENGTTGYIFRPGKSWENNAIAIRQTSNGSTTPENAVYVIDRTRFGANTPRANFSNANPRYATVLSDSDAIRIFEGTEIPTASTGGNSYKAGSRTTTDNNSWFAYGAQFDGSPRSPRNNLQAFNGTLHAARYYSKALSEEDLAWNRVIDEYRFFGASAPIPVTNVVVATSVAGADGDQPCGAYALDAEGFTFTAPAQRTVGGMRYVLAGYTLATWNGSDWSAAETFESGSYAASDAGKVLLTWRYERPAGEGRIVIYDVGDYVQDGLVLLYDGIRNVGADAAHDSAAHQWKNIAPDYASRWPMDWCSYVIKGDPDSYGYVRNNYTQGEWADDGFAFNGKGYFAKWSDGDPFSIPANFTMQFAMTAAIADQPSDVSYVWTGSANWDRGSVALRRTNGSSEALGLNNCAYYVNNLLFAGNARPNFYPAEARPSYLTTIVDYTNRTAWIFEGTERPAAGGRDAPAIDGSSPEATLTWYSVGGFHNRTGVESALQCFKGTLHGVRFYNRALTDAEVAQNRKVDEYRFHGRYTDPNVTVQSSHSYLTGYDACGAYEVEGSYVFAAPESVTAPNGISYACDGYTIETQDANGIWGAAVPHDTRSYRYETSAGTVRLTWQWRATHGIRTAADYTAEDYVAGGLVLHYDGIRNAGADEPHSTTAATWANLAGDGDYPLDWVSWVYQAGAGNYRRITGDQTCGAWTDNGFAFDGFECFATKDVGFVLPPNYTLQFAMTATAVDQSETGGTAYLFRPYENWTWGSVCFRTTANSGITPANAIYTVDANRYGNNNTRPNFANVSPRYATVLGAPGTLSCFEGTSIPASGNSIRAGTRAGGYDLTAIAFGGVYDAATTRTKAQLQNFVGTLHAIRYYDRALTEEELIRNRDVDSARFFGALATTNMVVEVEEDAGIEANPGPGFYKVEGAFDFAASLAAQPSMLCGRLSDWDENTGKWTNSRTVSGTYAYDASKATAPKQLLRWSKIRAFVLIVH